MYQTTNNAVSFMFFFYKTTFPFLFIESCYFTRKLANMPTLAQLIASSVSKCYMEIQRMTHHAYLDLTKIMSRRRRRGETIIGACRSVWTQLNTYARMTQWESSYIWGQSTSRYSWGQSSCTCNFDGHRKGRETGIIDVIKISDSHTRGKYYHKYFVKLNILIYKLK